jgi:hypothetical protein
MQADLAQFYVEMPETAIKILVFGGQNCREMAETAGN